MSQKIIILVHTSLWLKMIFTQLHQAPLKLEVLVSGDNSTGGVEVSNVFLVSETFYIEDELC